MEENFSSSSGFGSPSCEDTLTELRNACKGLGFYSEIDSPITAFGRAAAGDVTAAILLQKIGMPGETEVREVALDQFFGPLTRTESGDADAAKKFLELRSLLEERLRRIKVFKIGRIRVQIYVVGLGPSDCLLGIRTEAVET